MNPTFPSHPVPNNASSEARLTSGGLSTRSTSSASSPPPLGTQFFGQPASSPMPEQLKAPSTHASSVPAASEHRVESRGVSHTVSQADSQRESREDQGLPAASMTSVNASPSLPNGAQSLRDLPFIDVYVRLDGESPPLYRSRVRGQQNISQFVPPEFHASIADFAATVRACLHDADGALAYDGVRMRLSRQKMSDDTLWVCGRRINQEPAPLDKLGINPSIIGHMANLGKRDGLILISGATGAGKTTTATSLLCHFLRTYGGTAVTLEDPVEYIMHGRHGEYGQCFQAEIRTDEDWAIGLKRALRWAPRYIYVGEIRTPKAAEQLLRAASTGHTVITTVHAGSPDEALMGILFLAEQAMGPGCNSILAASLTALAYQNMTENGPCLRYVFTEENAPGDPVRAIIRENKIGMISTYIDRQIARLSSGTQASMPPPQPKKV